MEFIFADSKRVDTVEFPSGGTIDINVGKDNDFEIVLPLSLYDTSKYMKGGYFYAPNEEYGGLIDGIEVNTAEGVARYRGKTWRGLLQRQIVEPNDGDDYALFSGELNKVITDIVGKRYGNLFEVVADDTGETVTNYKARYGTVYDVLNDLLATVEYRLNIEVKAVASEFSVVLSAVPIVDRTDEAEVTQDYGFNFIIRNERYKYYYMILLGKGELKNRMVRYLKLNSKGKPIACDEIPRGLNVSVYVHDYPNAEDEADLIKSGKEKFKDLIEGDGQEVSVPDGSIDFPLFDIVGGRDYVTGMYVAEAITSKVVKYANGNTSISYKVGE